MEKQCCVCNQKIPYSKMGYTICEGDYSHVLCEDCNAYLDWMKGATSKVDLDASFAYFKPVFDNDRVPAYIKDALIAIRFKNEAKEEEEVQRKACEEAVRSLLLTTGSNFEGYRITKYIDVLCEEVVFKNSSLGQLSTNLENPRNAITFRARELTESSRFIADAREHAMGKFKKKAAELGANAVLGMAFESAVGAEIVRVSVFGTAVIVEKLA